jgi:hypothetical protein
MHRITKSKLELILEEEKKKQKLKPGLVLGLWGLEIV